MTMSRNLRIFLTSIAAGTAITAVLAAATEEHARGRRREQVGGVFHRVFAGGERLPARRPEEGERLPTVREE